MTETEWLTSTEPKALWKFLKCRLRHRKLRLFAVACCCRIAGQLADQCSRNAIAVAERYADGDATDEELRLANEAASDAHRRAYEILSQAESNERVESGGMYLNEAKVATCLEWAAVQVTDPSAWKAAESVSWMSATPRQPGAVTAVDYSVQAHLVREIFGSPFHHVIVQPEWLTWNSGSVQTLCRAVYHDRAFERLPELAAMLERAGCRQPKLLQHFQQQGFHVRGCWALDLLLGKK